MGQLKENAADSPLSETRVTAVLGTPGVCAVLSPGREASILDSGSRV